MAEFALLAEKAHTASPIDLSLNRVRLSKIHRPTAEGGARTAEESLVLSLTMVILLFYNALCPLLTGARNVYFVQEYGQLVLPIPC
jgi:hypothetical protein